ncbi:hypothetical protein ATO4_26120 [Aurantimonas sp. 22II-16-19i]|nr:hypothetical protein ATO4_26120 [Aurantimonas sp. 22II-16-19i]
MARPAFQLRVLRDFAKLRDVTIVILSQVDRSFDGLGRPMPPLRHPSAQPGGPRAVHPGLLSP